MPNRGGNDLREIETLTRSAEIVLRKLVGFLVGRISLVKLQEMVRFIYVEAAEDQLKSESPSKNVALTKLALVTGLDTRTLTRTRNHETYRRPFHKKSAFLREFTPAAQILDVWSSSPKYLDRDTNLPRKLRLSGASDSFEELFTSTIKSRGLTQQSLLDRLLDNGAVRLCEDGESVELVKQSYLPIHSAEQLGAFEMGYAAAANLMDTIVHNFESDSDAEKYFQRGVWTHRLPAQRRDDLRAVLNSLLERTEKECREVLLGFEEDFENPSQLTAGISLFYFEDEGE